MGPKKKLDVLKGSLESGAIEREEYEKETEKLKPALEEHERKMEEARKSVLEEEPKKSSEWILITAIIVIIALLAAVLAFSHLFRQKQLTLEEMHVLNLQGKLKPEQGYIYKGAYSFVTLDKQWYTQLSSPNGTKVYSLALRYSPRELENITIAGTLNTGLFDSAADYYVTFNPKGSSLSYDALAIADFETHLAKVFGKTPIGACDRNETEICKTRQIITCDSTDKLVLYVRESEKFRAYYKSNCIVIEGSGLDLVRGADRVLYNLYGIMD